MNVWYRQDVRNRKGKLETIYRRPRVGTVIILFVNSTAFRDLVRKYKRVLDITIPLLGSTSPNMLLLLFTDQPLWQSPKDAHSHSMNKRINIRLAWFLFFIKRKKRKKDVKLRNSTGSPVSPSGHERPGQGCRESTRCPPS